MKEIWASRGWKACLLLPVSALFGLLAAARRNLYSLGVLRKNQFSVPVVVVGNISVGGTGKTPIVSVLTQRIQARGLRPGIVSRGYGAPKADHPRLVTEAVSAAQVGDEPALLFRDTQVPMCIGANRSAAVKMLVAECGVDVVVSDDGLQHYAMSRDIEIAVVDGQRGVDNGFLLPAGPLREPVSRLHQVDVIAVQQAVEQVAQKRAKLPAWIEGLGTSSPGQPACGQFYLNIATLKNVKTQQAKPLESLSGQCVHAVAGLGNPQRFFSSLSHHGLKPIEHAMPDHHRYTTADFAFDDDLPVLITGKDAVKVCELELDFSNIYEVCVAVELDDALGIALDELVAKLASMVSKVQ